MQIILLCYCFTYTNLHEIVGHLFANATRTRVTNILDSKIYVVQSHHPLTHISGDNITGKLRAQYTSTIAYFNIHTDSIVLLEF